MCVLHVSICSQSVSPCVLRVIILYVPNTSRHVYGMLIYYM
jgi:hypothetical protein